MPGRRRTLPLDRKIFLFLLITVIKGSVPHTHCSHGLSFSLPSGFQHPRPAPQGPAQGQYPPVYPPVALYPLRTKGGAAVLLPWGHRFVVPYYYQSVRGAWDPFPFASPSHPALCTKLHTTTTTTMKTSHIVQNCCQGLPHLPRHSVTKQIFTETCTSRYTYQHAFQDKHASPQCAHIQS